MKKLLMLLMLVPTLVMAQPNKPELTPSQKIEVANALTALIVGAPVVLSAVATGKQKELCEVLQGKWTPDAGIGQDICPGGDWVRILPYLQNIKE